MNRSEPPDPPPERAGAELPDSAPSNQIPSAGERFCLETIHSAQGSQHLASVDEAAEILDERLPRYHHYESNDWSDGTNWRLDRATPKQIVCLHNFGIDATGASLGHCSRLIGKLIRRKQKGLASFSDVRWLTRHGVENARKLTSHEARRIIELISYEQTEVAAQRLEGGAK